jgi:hypothetical protein
MAEGGTPAAAAAVVREVETGVEGERAWSVL